MSSDSVERIGGWLLAPLAWLLVALLSASLSLLFFADALMSSQTYTLLSAMSIEHLALWIASLAFAIAMWYYTLWLTIAFFKRRKGVPKHYIIWLLITLLLAVKPLPFPYFRRARAAPAAFPSPRRSAACAYFRRSQRVKRTFVNP